MVTSFLFCLGHAVLVILLGAYNFIFFCACTNLLYTNNENISSVLPTSCLSSQKKSAYLFLVAWRDGVILHHLLLVVSMEI